MKKQLFILLFLCINLLAEERIITLSPSINEIVFALGMGKKVVAIEGKHLPKYKNVHSPIKNSSVTHISSSSQFDIDDKPNANAFDKVTDEIAWGSNGPINLSKFLFEKIID